MHDVIIVRLRKPWQQLSNLAFCCIRKIYINRHVSIIRWRS